jgi:SnoaL-like domain
VFDWLFEARLSVSFLLLLVGVVLLVLWWQRRNRRLLLALAAVGFLALVYFLLGFLGETDREQITRKVQEMGQAVDRKDLELLSRHISEQFEYKRTARTLDKKALLDQTRSAIDRFGVRDARVSSLDVTKLDQAKGTATVEFRGSADNNRMSRVAVPVEADFVRDPDGQWRLKTIRFFRPFVNNLEPWDPFGEP